MLRVLHFAATGHGGLATHVVTLATGLDRSKYEVRVLAPSGSDLERRLAQTGIPVDTLPFRVDGQFIRELPLLPQVHRYIADGHFDIVHLHSTKAGVWGRLSAAIAQVPVVLYTPNGYRFLRFRRGAPGWRAWSGVEWLMGRLGGYVVAAGPSEGQLARELRLALEGRVFVVNNGVAAHPGEGSAGVRERLGLGGSGPLVVKIGRLAGQKAPLDFVAAAGIVARARPDVTFALLGKGDLEAAVRRAIAREGLEHRLHIVPFTAEVPALLRETDVFVMTSKHEGLSYAAAEAAAAQCGLVLSDVPGLRDLVVDGVSGRLVPPGDVPGFAAAIVDLLDHPDRRRAWGAEAARIVGEQFSVDNMIRATEALYQRLSSRDDR